MARMKIGCQTYTWEMLGKDWKGSPDDILDIVAGAGYAGVEFSNNMIGPYLDSPDLFASALRGRNLACAAYAFATTGFTDPGQFDQDLNRAKRALHFCAALKVPFCAGGASSTSRSDYAPKFEQAIYFYRSVAELGGRLGVTVCVHPHSDHGSLLNTAEEYDALLAATKDSGLMFNPDAGHIMRSGQNLMECLRRHRERIAHVHIKDPDAEGKWKPLGEGVINWKELLAYFDRTGYRGWIVAEDESDSARANPAAAITRNREFLARMGL